MAVAATERLEDGASGDALPAAEWKTPEELARIVSEFAETDGWLERVRLRADERWYERLHCGADYDLWVISWMPGQATGFHDHGESAGAFAVATGVLEEHRPGEARVEVARGQPRCFGPAYAHDVRNGSGAPAVSLHAYSPPLSEMMEFDLEEGALVPRERASVRAEELAQETRGEVSRGGAMSVAGMLAAARARLQRLLPEEAEEALRTGDAVLVDIRPAGQRAAEGEVPGAMLIERNVLEWRFDPASSARLPMATGHAVRMIVLCSEGYTSSLAAAALQDLGLWRATDVIGGFKAWQARGLPTVSEGGVRTG